MHKSILVALVICAVLIVDSHGWRRWRHFAEHVATAGAVAGALGGKRSAACEETLTPDEMDQLGIEMKNTCLDLGINVEVTGLNRTQVMAMFQVNDADADGVLKDKEISGFSETIQLVEACAAAEGGRKK